MSNLPSRLRPRGVDGASQVTPLPGAMRSWTLGILCVAFAALSAATVLSQRVHDATYSVVAPLVRALCGEECLRNSPTESRKRAIDAAVTDLARENARLQGEHRALEASTLTLVAATDLLLKRHETIKRSARGVSSRLASRIARGAGRKTASVVGQAIPFFGVALVWGLAALEVSEACDAMKDLAELDEAVDGSRSSEVQTVCGLRVPTTGEIADRLARGWQEAYEATARAINADGRVTVSATPPAPNQAQAESYYCRIFGC